MGTMLKGPGLQAALLRAVEASAERLDSLELRVAELEEIIGHLSRQNDELHRLLRLGPDAPQAPDAEAEDVAWDEEQPAGGPRKLSADEELFALVAELDRAPNDVALLAHVAERAEVLGDIVFAVDTLERLADAFPVGRERRRALLHAARLAHGSLEDSPRALGLARSVLADHPADAEARKLVSLYSLG